MHGSNLTITSMFEERTGHDKFLLAINQNYEKIDGQNTYQINVSKK